MGAWGWFCFRAQSSLCIMVEFCFLNGETVPLKWCFFPPCIPEDPSFGNRVLYPSEHETAEGAQCFLKIYWRAPKCTASPCMDIPCQTGMLTVTSRNPVLLLNKCTKCVHQHLCFQSLQTVTLHWATCAQGKCLLQISLLLLRWFRVGV